MKKLFLPILAILILFSSCSTFYGGVTGTVVDSESGSAINNVLVALYFDEGARNSDYDSYEKASHALFRAPSADGVANTTANGSYSFSKVYWQSGNPKYGKDGDKTNIYLLFYHEDYGLTKFDSPVTLYSESTSQIQDARLTSIVDTYTYNLDLREVRDTAAATIKDSSSLTNGMTFKYRYTDYRGVNQSATVTANNGSYTFSIRYYKDTETPTVPSITLSEFVSSNTENDNGSVVEQYSVYANGTIDPDNYTYTLSKNSSRTQTDYIYFVRNYHTISASGTVLDNESGNAVNNAKVSIYFDETVRDSDYNEYENNLSPGTIPPEFTAPNAKASVNTNAAGSYTFTNVFYRSTPSNSQSTQSIKDAEVYLIIYHQDYGVVKHEDIIDLYDANDQIEEKRITSEIDTYTYTVNLRELLDNSGTTIDSTALSGRISFRYSYTDYRGEVQSGDVTATGSYAFTVNYYKRTNPDIPSITLTDFESANKEFNGSTDINEFTLFNNTTGEVVLSADYSSSTREKNEYIYFVKNYFSISISGTVYSSDKITGRNNAEVSLTISDNASLSWLPSTPAKVSTAAEIQTGNNRQNGLYSGLGSDLVIFINRTDATIISPITFSATVSAEYGEENGRTFRSDFTSSQSSYSVVVNLETI